MDKKSFLLGTLTGVVLTFVALIVIAFMIKDSDTKDSVQYLNQPTSYENKKETAFKVFQVFDDAALAREASDYDIYYDKPSEDMYLGNTVLIVGKNFYSDQIIVIKDPQRIGNFKYTNKGGMPMVVPVIDGKSKE